MKIDTWSSIKIDTSTMLLQQSLTTGSGQYRQQAFSNGKYAVRQLDARIQEIFIELEPSPTGWQWVPVSDGYLCRGGTHFIPDHEIHLMLDDASYWPDVERRNHPIAQETEDGEFFKEDIMSYYPLQRPPEQLSKSAKAWATYEDAKKNMRKLEAGYRASFINPGVHG